MLTEQFKKAEQDKVTKDMKEMAFKSNDNMNGLRSEAGWALYNNACEKVGIDPNEKVYSMMNGFITGVDKNEKGEPE